MTVRELLTVMRTRWRIIAVCVLAVVGVTAVVTTTIPRVYQATARVYLSTTKAKGDNGQTGTYVITRQDLNTYVEVLGAPDVMNALRTKVGVPAGTPLNVTATVSDLSNVLDFTVTGGDPQLVADTANAAGPVLAAQAEQFSPLLALNGQSVTARPIAPATVPGSPVSPNVTRNLMLALLAGLVIGVGLALIRHATDTKIRTEKDIRAYSDRPILAKLPVVKDEGGTLTLADNPHSHHAEAIRRLRTNILFVDVTTQGHSFVITSANPGEGKTTISVNLAMAMADTGSKVLLIDGDLRNPSVAKTMGIEGSSGLTTILLGRARPDEVIQRWRDTTLHVLPAGQIPPNPSELLGSEAMSQLFQKLSQDFDFILVDSPPINPVIDAVLLHRLTNGLLMVVAAERTRRRELESALRSLETVEVPVAGFALNVASSSVTGTYSYGALGYGQTAELHQSRSSRTDHRRSRRHARR